MRKSSRKGVALAVALALSVLFLILGMAYLTFVGTDYFLNGTNYDSLQAYYLAKSGLNWYTNHGFYLPSGSSVTIRFQGLNPQRYFCKVIRQPNGQLIFQGVVQNRNSEFTKNIVIP